MPSLSNIFSWSESQQFLLLLLLWAVEPRNRVNWCVLLQTPSKNVYLVSASDWMYCVLQAYSHQRHGMAFWKNSAHCLILCFVCFRHEHRTAVSGESLGRHFELQRKGGEVALDAWSSEGQAGPFGESISKSASEPLLLTFAHNSDQDQPCISAE